MYWQKLKPTVINGKTYDLCPKCKGELEQLIDNDEFPHKERCPECRWVVEFDNNNKYTEY